MKKILVFSVNWLGDVIFSSPVFYALREQYPQAEIICIAVPRVEEILRCIPVIDRIIVYDEKGRHRSLIGKIKMAFQLRREKFDIAFLLRPSLTRAFLFFMAGIPVRVGYATKKKRNFLTHPAAWPKENLHRSDQYLRVVESLSIRVKDRQCRMAVDRRAADFSQKFMDENNIADHDFFVILNPGGNWDLKRWPEENFARLADHLVQKFKAKIGICGSPGDIEIAKRIAAQSKYSVICFAGQTTLAELAAIFQKASLVISADSGPLHIANSVGTKTIGLFGPTHPEVTGPRGPGKSVVLHPQIACNKNPCYQLDCKNNICMKGMTVTDVIQAIKEKGY